jgi:hypothetical protein
MQNMACNGTETMSVQKIAKLSLRLASKRFRLNRMMREPSAVSTEVVQ